MENQNHSEQTLVLLTFCLRDAVEGSTRLADVGFTNKVTNVHLFWAESQNDVEEWLSFFEEELSDLDHTVEVNPKYGQQAPF